MKIDSFCQHSPTYYIYISDATLNAFEQVHKHIALS